MKKTKALKPVRHQYQIFNAGNIAARERIFRVDRRTDRDRLGSHKKTCPANCRAGFKLVVRPKGLEPLLQAPEACVISTSLRARLPLNLNTRSRQIQES